MKDLTSTEIESIKFIMNSYSEKSKLIDIQLKKYNLNTDFMREFGQYISQESFSSSPGLTYELIKSYSELFDKDIWLNSPTKSLDPLRYDEFLDIIGEENIEKILLNINASQLSEDIFLKYFNNTNVSTDAKKKLINSTNFTLTPEFIIENAEYITEKIFTNVRNKVKWDRHLVEGVFNNKELTMLFFINALLMIDDLGFIKRMLEENSLKFAVTGGTFDSELKSFITFLPDSYMGPLFDKITQYSKNALSYNVLEHLLDMKDFLTEEFLLEYIQPFKDNALQGKLASYARERDYRAILLNLKIT
jgi:hypothetical protein